MSFYDAVVPAYLQMLNSLIGLLTKAEAHCAAKKIDPSVMLGSRLFPDMLPLSKQIQLASDFAVREPTRHQHEHLALAVGQAVEAGRGAELGRRPAGELGHEPAGDRRRH